MDFVAAMLAMASRYCIVPFMDVPVDNKIVEYILRCSYKEGTLDFEVKDLVKVSLPFITPRNTLYVLVLLMLVLTKFRQLACRRDLLMTCHRMTKMRRKKRRRW